VAAFGALAIAAVAVGLVSLFGPMPGPPAVDIPSPLLVVGVLLFRRPMFVVVTSERLICLRLSQFRRAPRQLAFAAPLAEVRIVKYRLGRRASSIQCEIPGRKRIRLYTDRAGRKDFDQVLEALTRAGAFAELDPPWPGSDQLRVHADRKF